MRFSEFLAVGGLVAAMGCRAGETPTGEVEVKELHDAATASTVAEVLESARHPWLRWSDLSDVALALAELYEGEPDHHVWFRGDEPHALEEALAALSNARARALDPADFDAQRLESEWKNVQALELPDSRERALFDVALSVGVLRAMQSVHSGRVDPRTLGWGYDVRPKKLDRAALLRAGRDGEGIAALLDDLEPSFPHYRRNRAVLVRYRGLAEKGEPVPVPSLPRDRTKLEPGDSWAGVPALRARLRLLGDLQVEAPDAAGSDAYDAELAEAVKRFQTRHILDADGVAGKATLEALNVPIAARVRQLELAMERGRWLPRLDERPSVFVNVPLFRMWATDPVRGDEPLRMNVVVGKSMSHRTPIFMEEMKYVVFRPYWNPPPSIVRNEILPSARRDPGYLDREDLEIVASGADDAPAYPPLEEHLDAVAAGRLYVRQRPGPENSLGLAKFIFPNEESVYMHGTPARHLFSRTRRDFSHGCIRVEDPARLAEWVLRESPGWTGERIEAAMQGERPTQVNLRELLMVVIFYDTVHVNSENVVHFVNDIYGHDRALDEALDRGYPYTEAE
jgi:murein L,D-transpeptidase YcbB/YkuD